MGWLQLLVMPIVVEKMNMYFFWQTYNYAICKNMYEFRKKVFTILGNNRVTIA
jgi:hypothetical protein